MSPSTEVVISLLARGAPSCQVCSSNDQPLINDAGRINWAGLVSSWELWGEATGIKNVLTVGKVHGLNNEMLMGISL